ncbi:MAG: AAA family ATPase [Acetobacteraceae bacterium]|nr:AAA family ATPase [Acetobacteraceae bacterium]
MRLLQLSITNFRGFGPTRTEIDVGADLVLLYGPNGFGKTSLAEAIEWLFYGNTLRRQRGETYSKTEYAGSFANVHGGGTAEVSARVLWQGRDVTLTRRLKADETSETLVDGGVLDFSTIGLAPPEVAYPVVAQHALQLLIHQKPKNRRDAICEALGLDELTNLKSALDSARTSFQRTPPTPVQQARTALGKLLPGLRQIPSLTKMVQRWSKATPSVDPQLDIIALMTAAAEPTGETYGDEAAALAGLRQARQRASAAVFDLATIAFAEDHEAGMAMLSRGHAALTKASEQLSRDVAAAAAASAATYAAELLNFWTAGLRIAPDGDTCPMCEAATLDAARRTELAARIAGSKAVFDSQKAVVSSAAVVATLAKELTAAVTALGTLALARDADRAALLRLLPDHPGEVAAFLDAHDSLTSQRATFDAAVADATRTAAEAPQNAARPADLPDLVAALSSSRDTLDAAVRGLTEALHAYLGAWLTVKPPLDGKVAEDGLVARIDAVGIALRDAGHIRVLGRYDAVLADSQVLIRAVEEEIQRKQGELLVTRGQEVKDLHDLLHPGSDVGFDGMEPATDSMKLHAKSFNKRMPAAATLSQCQLNCLGLAMWLMRATTPGSPFGFIVLDDPVQAMDDDHTEAFIATVVPHLLDTVGKQLIVLSHAQALTDRLRDLHFDRSIGHYHIEKYEITGPVLIQRERLKRMIHEIKQFAKGTEHHRALAVDRLRVLTEAFIRELYLRKTGTPTAATYASAGASKLLEVFIATPDTDPREHARMRDTVGFCDPAHHDEVGYSVPKHAQILPHLDRVEGLLRKYGLL